MSARTGRVSLDGSPAGNGAEIAPRKVNNYKHHSSETAPTRSSRNTPTAVPPAWLLDAPSLAGLTPTQVAIARLIAAGHADKVIAARIDRSEDTVAYHITRIANILRLDRTRNIRVLIGMRVYIAASRELALRKRVSTR